MLRIKTSKALVLAVGAIAAGTAFAPLASAEPCESTGAATVCQSNGSSSITAVPGGAGGGDSIGAGPFGGQNGPYGSNGNLPPIGN